MALVQFGGGVASMRGSIAGTTFSKNKGGSYARNKVTPVNPRTPKQNLVRSIFGTLSSAWSGLTATEQQTWIDQAPAYPRVNIFGDPAPLTGQGLYNSLNGQLAQLSSPVFNTAIPPIEVAGATFDSVTVDIVIPEITVDQLSSTEDETLIAIYATAPQSAGKRFVKTEYRLVGVKPPGGAAGSFDLTAGYASVFGLAPADIPVSSKVFVKVRKVSATNGQVSTDFASNGEFILVTV